MCVFTLFLCCFALSALGPADEQLSTDESAQASSLIQGLADPDPTRRADAAERLRQLGERARPALVTAARSNNPSIASAAGEILLDLPWYRPDDPPAMREALRIYGRGDAEQRIQSIRAIAEYPHSIANRVLVRLLLEEPSEEVCWQIVSILRRNLDPPAAEALRRIDQTSPRASGLVLAARVWFLEDRQRCRELLQRAIQIETSHPTLDGGEMDFAFDALVGAAVNQHDFDHAARLRRLQSARAGQASDSGQAAISQLFALHARYGPLSGFEQDLQTYQFCGGRPAIVYALAQMWRRHDHPAAATAVAQAAAFASLTTASREPTWQFLYQNHWDDLAKFELSMIARSSAPEAFLERISAILVLAEVAGRNDDHLAAAKHLTDALKLIEASGQPLEVTDEAGRRAPFELAILGSRIDWRLFRASLEQNDATAADQPLTNLLAAKTWNSEIVTDMVPYLKSTGREQDAARLFDAEYEKLRARLAKEPHRAVLLNAQAWLCARSGERLDEALQLATRAVGTTPAEAAFLDTLAEAHSQLGHFDEAIRLEQAALELQPDDPFMLQQLERFKRRDTER